MQKRLIAAAFATLALVTAGAATLGGCAKESTLGGAEAKPLAFVGPSLRGRTAGPRTNEQGARRAPELLPQPGGTTPLLALCRRQSDQSDARRISTASKGSARTIASSSKVLTCV